MTKEISSRAEDGFTIIELLIATVVFSVILVLITVGVIGFNNAYYKGTTQSDTQATARTVLQDVAQAIQFDSAQVTAPIGTTGSGASKGFCIGDTRFSYLLGWELVTGTPNTTEDQTNHALVEDTPGNCSGLDAQNLQGTTVEGTELLSPSMRVANLSVSAISGSTDLYKVSVTIVYGDNDLLNNPTSTNPTCKLETGDEFCATSTLSTTVEGRLD